MLHRNATVTSTSKGRYMKEPCVNFVRNRLMLLRRRICVKVITILFTCKICSSIYSILIHMQPFVIRFIQSYPCSTFVIVITQSYLHATFAIVFSQSYPRAMLVTVIVNTQFLK